MKPITIFSNRLSGVFQTIIKLHFLLIFFTCQSYATSFHVTEDGTANGDGSEFSPWDLRTALSHPSSVMPGDTIWLHSGTYKGHFSSDLVGSKDANIVVRQYPGERAIIDGVGRTGSGILTIKGEYTSYWGFTITDSNTQRRSQISGSFPSDIPNATGLNVMGHHIKLINIIVHDAPGNGIAAWKQSIDTEIYGCIIYHNGWQGPDRGHGHAFYSQNLDGTKVVMDNLMFNNFSMGLHVYTENGSIQGFHIEGNSCFNNGIISGDTKLTANALVGGSQPADRLVYRDNYTFHNSSIIADNVRFGYDVANGDIIVKDNYMMGGFPVLRINNWNSVELSGNTILGFGKLVYLEVPSGVQTSSYNWDNNMYYAGTHDKPYNHISLNFDQWKQTYSIDANSQYTTLAPVGTKVFVRPNKYEAGRSYITVYNWDLKNSVDVDLSDLIEEGASYEIFDIEYLGHEPLLAGKYDGGSVSIPMNLTKTVQPIGNVPTAFNHTGLEFGVYLIKSNPINQDKNQYLTDTKKAFIKEIGVEEKNLESSSLEY